MQTSIYNAQIGNPSWTNTTVAHACIAKLQVTIVLIKMLMTSHAIYMQSFV